METPVSVTESSQVAEARRHAVRVAQASDLSETLQGKAALVVTEAATNLVKYGRGGYVLVRPYAEPLAHGLEILVLDQGPGIARIEESLDDGFSTGGTLGYGLGAIARLSSQFEIYTAAGAGTAIMARLDDERRPAEPVRRKPPLAVGGVTTPKSGQEACGDAWSCRWADGTFWVASVDGLGHGPQAATAAAEAVRVFHAVDGGGSPYDVLRDAHKALKATRGAVMAVAAIRPALGTMDFAGVGNISAVLIQEHEQRRLSSMDGTLGYSVRAIREQSYSWTPSSMLVLASDGLSTRWNLGEQVALRARHPSLVAAVLHRDYARGMDDASVVVIKGLAP
ncbi:ATP-binding protein [Bordetella flabilis]|nr:ATP-binding protein [Bordetella flabilis]